MNRLPNTQPIPGFDGRYLITQDGRVWSVPRRAGQRPCGGRWLKQQRTYDNYWRVKLSKRSYARYYLVAPLVLGAWVGPRPKGMDACHNDGDKSNNCVSNLRWDTRKANVADCLRHGRHSCLRRGNEHNSNILLEHEVELAKDLYHQGVSFAELGRMFGHYHAIYKAIKGKNWRWLD